MPETSDNTMKGALNMTAALRCLAIPVFMLAAFSNAVLSADPAAELQQIEEQIKAVERVAEGQTPAINPGNLTYIEAMLEQLRAGGSRPALACSGAQCLYR